MTSAVRPPMLAFYGDDFTGSTDALESLSLAGVRTVLFLEPPDVDQLARFPDAWAIGVAGMTRTMAPETMAEVLREAFRALRSTGAPFVHYKVCSTFDSSPETGSIGRAIDVGLEVFSSPFVPVVVGAPALGRHCVFGNLFARFGTGGASNEVNRLDRHPAMSRHPVTPSDEADLRFHLARQTDRRIGLVNVMALLGGAGDAEAALAQQLDAGAEIVFFDLLDGRQLPVIGEVLERRLASGQAMFCVGSSGLGAALGARWIESGRAVPAPASGWAVPGEAGPLLVLSGSASPVTAGQIDAAVAAGFDDVAIDPRTLARPVANGAGGEGGSVSLGRVLEALGSGRPVVAHTCRGPDDPRLRESGLGGGAEAAEVLGRALGRIALAAARAGLAQRIVFCGGDTSSFAARALGLEAVEMVAPLAPGAPLCRASSRDPAVDGLELNFKGGQVGEPDYLLQAARPR